MKDSKERLKKTLSENAEKKQQIAENKEKIENCEGELEEKRVKMVRLRE
jgi:septal ring factor EnvC (AmiA/AmiB activator)